MKTLETHVKIRGGWKRLLTTPILQTEERPNGTFVLIKLDKKQVWRKVFRKFYEPKTLTSPDPLSKARKLVDRRKALPNASKPGTD